MQQRQGILVACLLGAISVAVGILALTVQLVADQIKTGLPDLAAECMIARAQGWRAAWPIPIF